MIPARLQLRLIEKYRRASRGLRKAVRAWETRSSGISNEFDRTPLARANITASVAPMPHHPDDGSEMAIYSTFCGSLAGFTFDRNNRARNCPHYFVSNNRRALKIVADYGWKPIFLDLPIRRNPVESASQAKIAKALPHLFPDLARHRFLVYTDDKQRIPHDQLPDFSDRLARAGGAMALRESPHIKDNVLWEFTDSLFQDRYRVQSHQMLRYLLEQLEAGKTLAVDHLFMTGFVLRDMAHPETERLNEAWYADILACGIDCQLVFDFLAQDEPTIVALPAPKRRKYLGKRIDDDPGPGTL